MSPRPTLLALLEHSQTLNSAPCLGASVNSRIHIGKSRSSETANAVSLLQHLLEKQASLSHICICALLYLPRYRAPGEVEVCHSRGVKIGMPVALQHCSNGKSKSRQEITYARPHRLATDLPHSMTSQKQKVKVGPRRPQAPGPGLAALSTCETLPWQSLAPEVQGVHHSTVVSQRLADRTFCGHAPYHSEI